MFESDDFDQELSQIDFSDAIPNKVSEPLARQVQHQTDFCSLSGNVSTKHIEATSCRKTDSPSKENFNKNIQRTGYNSSQESQLIIDTIPCKTEMLKNQKNAENSNSTSKRKMIDSFFDHSTKRKFPGPAGVLSGKVQESEDSNICQMELLSQDVAFSERHVNGDIFETAIWKRISQDIEIYNLGRIDLIRSIKHTKTGHLRRRKADTVVAFVEAVDRSASDPMIMLRDLTGGIKCTLHRDAWAAFSTYLVSDCCALILKKPTILTTGTLFKRYYLNITLSNIIAMYSSFVNGEDLEKCLPIGYSADRNDGFTIIKLENINTDNVESPIQNDDLLDGLDSSMFADEVFN